MKKRIVVFLAAAMAAICAQAETETEKVGDYTWRYRINGDTAEICQDYISGISYPAISPNPTGAVTIPSTLGGKSVTSIGGWAFQGCSGLTSVMIPDSVTSIEGFAFGSCTGLTSVAIGNGVTSIVDYAFSYCRGLTSVTIGNGVTSIGTFAFDGCSGLTVIAVDAANSTYKSENGLLLSKDGKTLILGINGNVTIPSGVTSIGRGAFSGCSGLTSVTIPDSVTSIGGWAFQGCSGLTSVTIPDSVTSIGADAFEAFDGCNESLIDTVTIPGVRIVDGWAIGHTGTYLGSLDLTGLRGIGDDAFYDCGGLTSVTIGNSVKSIGYEAFCGCGGLTSVTIGNSVTNIGWRAFSDGWDLTSVTIPDSVTSIEAEAFDGCEGLTSVTIGNGVKSIEWGAFYDCRGLTSVTIPAGVTSIEAGVFCNCSGLKSFVVANGNPSYKAISGLLLTKDGKMLVAVPGGLTSVTIPAGVTSIEEDTFWGCCVTSVTIPASVTSIGLGAFYNSMALETVHVEVGDTDRVKSLLSGSGCDVSSITFVEGLGPGPVTPDPVSPDPVTPGSVAPNPSTPAPVAPDPVTPGYEVIEATDIVAPYEAPKAVALQGAVYDGGKVVGIVELKLGKVNDKKGTGKVSGSVTALDGKKHTITASNLEGIDGKTSKAVSLEVKGFGTMSVTIGGTQFAGSMGRYHVQSANVGGDWSKGGAKVYVDAGGASGGRALPEGTIEDLLPDGEPVVALGGKWKFAKAASVKWAKPKQGAALPERYDAESGKGLLVDTSGDKTNLSAMKLTYTPKKGTFKGSFKVYALEGAGKATKLKKYTVNVSGVVVGGVGHGTATCKTPAVSWSVTVK